MAPSKTRDFSGIKTEDLETMLAAGSSAYTKEEQKSIRAELAKRSGSVPDPDGEGNGLVWQPIGKAKRGTSFFAFQGRLNRLRFFLYTLFIVASLIAISTIIDASDNPLVALVALVFLLFLSVMNLSLLVRRFHDLDRSGQWSVLLGMTPIYFVGMPYLLLKRGTKGLNKYGPDPLANA